MTNKANLRDLITAIGPLILLELDSNRRFFDPCDLDMWWKTSKNDRAFLLYHVKLCASIQGHGWIQTGVTVRKGPIRSKSVNFCPVWPWNWQITLVNNRATLLCYFKLCASFCSHWWTGKHWEHSEKVWETDGQTDRQTDGLNNS